MYENAIFIQIKEKERRGRKRDVEDEKDGKRGKKKTLGYDMTNEGEEAENGKDAKRKREKGGNREVE